MYTDIYGKKRYKVGLHTHTTQSDGHKTPKEAISIYKAMGYDALAITDHWLFSEGGFEDGMTLLSGIEYNIGGNTALGPVYHILGIGMTQDPLLNGDEYKNTDSPCVNKGKDIIAHIRKHGGLAILAHPAWSLNSPDDIINLWDFDGVEIYNSVSEAGMSDRPYSGLLVDMVASRGYYPPLLATDDTHYYEGEEGRGYLMVEAAAVDSMGYVNAIKAGKFYATQGPEIHLERVDETTFRLTCSPCEKIVFLSNVVWTKGRVIRDHDLTEATYTLKPNETFIRAEITDKEGKCGWSCIIPVSRLHA